MNSDRLAELRRVLAGQDPELLLPLLTEYGQRWKHDSNQIWSIGVIFIPLSLSGVLVAPGNNVRTLTVAFFSIVLIWIWYGISQGLRSRLDQAWVVYATIESALFKLDPPKINHGLTELVPRTGSAFSLRRLRLLIAIAITAAWLLVTISAFLRA